MPSGDDDHIIAGLQAGQALVERTDDPHLAGLGESFTAGEFRPIVHDDHLKTEKPGEMGGRQSDMAGARQIEADRTDQGFAMQPRLAADKGEGLIGSAKPAGQFAAKLRRQIRPGSTAGNIQQQTWRQVLRHQGQQHRRCSLGKRLRQGLEELHRLLCRFKTLQEDLHRPAADHAGGGGLAGGQIETQQGVVRSLRQKLPGPGDTYPLQLAAADAAEEPAIPAEQHPGPGTARRRTEAFDNGAHNYRLTLRQTGVQVL